MLHACVERFDVICERENILGYDGEVNKAIKGRSWQWKRKTALFRFCLVSVFKVLDVMSYEVLHRVFRY
jgi:hypothetical protein